MGLSQVYGFVKQSGGFVRIESAPQKGTSVHIYLPGRAQLPSVAAQHPPASDRVYSPCSKQGGKILVVEDQEEVRRQIVTTLQGIGCKTVEAGDGSTGLKLVESGEPFDLLVSDIGLPGLNGLQLAHAARAAYPDLPILLITGYAGKSAGTLQLAANMEVLRKPFRLDELAARVRSLFERAVAPEEEL
ncbi:response regulator [Methylocystis echinoides]|uniref:response regulator n=1 Tax=Methylocystis echinoides TaxID=29468 RepID=UPI003412EDEB